jgi:hypothetical protein
MYGKFHISHKRTGQRQFVHGSSYPVFRIIVLSLLSIDFFIVSIMLQGAMSSYHAVNAYHNPPLNPARHSRHKAHNT